jgi:hypothetical protein
MFNLCLYSLNNISYFYAQKLHSDQETWDRRDILQEAASSQKSV